MRDYISTVFNLIVGLVSNDKLVYLALIGLGIIIVWQSLSLFTSFHSRLSKKCRKISKFLLTKGLSAENYNQFLALIAKMPQEFIRGYKTFEHASYGLPSDYIKRFDSVDVEVNGGIFNHGKSVLKSFINFYGAILFVLQLALLGSENALTAFALADALVVPILFFLLAKILYYVFMAIKQQQYRVAIDEFNEMLDIMNDKIENNDSLPGPDIMVQAAAEQNLTESVHMPKSVEDEAKQSYQQSADVAKNVEAVPQQNDATSMEQPTEPTAEKLTEEAPQDADYFTSEELSQLEEQVTEPTVTVAEPAALPKNIAEPKPKQTVVTAQNAAMPTAASKRGRGRPKKEPEGELVITNDKQFEEVLARAEKLMRKSEEALSASQAKRVEKSLKELVDAMEKYKEEN